MIVIIEGADLVGKSTLAEALRRRYGWPIVKIRWALVGDVHAETRGMATATIKLLLALDPDVIFDRSYFSMWAYSEDPSFMPGLLAEFDHVSAQIDVALIVLTASEKELTRRYNAEPDEYFSLEIILRANARFRTLPKLVPVSLPMLELDTSRLSIGEVVEAVESFIG